jgi:uncharacterized protein (TIGR02145 family)
MMVDGKYADEEKTSSAWDESWVSPYYFDTGAPGSTPNADKNNARGGTYTHGGGRGICPMGWHVPTDYEWAYMLDLVEGNGIGNTFTNQSVFGTAGTDAGSKLKSTGTFTYSESDPGDGCWADHACRGTDDYSFSLQPTGFNRYNLQNFSARGLAAYMRTASVCNETKMLTYKFGWNSCKVTRTSDARSGGMPVRCVKD